MIRYILRFVHQPAEHELHAGLNTIGRNPTNELRVGDASVSSFHAEVDVEERGDVVTVRDLQSTNGTFINGQPVEVATLLPGQILQLGCVELRLDREEYQVTIPQAAAPKVALPAGQLNALPDGTLACSLNPGLPATHQAVGGCQAVVRCPGVFNRASLRSMKLPGGSGEGMLFCPVCSCKCEPIPGASTEESSRGGLLSRLTQTIRLGWKRK